jgi:4a-hydroxytetrahydrobiopterin dehydratase
MSKLLSVEQIAEALNGLPGWTQSGNAIHRTFTLPSFGAAMEFANRVAALAQRADHHPDILIQYKKVTLTLSTHSAGGLTDKDVALAREVNGIAD